jgi:hypothetical protein
MAAMTTKTPSSVYISQELPDEEFPPEPERRSDLGSSAIYNLWVFKRKNSGLDPDHHRQTLPRYYAPKTTIEQGLTLRNCSARPRILTLETAGF